MFDIAEIIMDFWAMAENKKMDLSERERKMLLQAASMLQLGKQAILDLVRQKSSQTKER